MKHKILSTAILSLLAVGSVMAQSANDFRVEQRNPANNGYSLRTFAVSTTVGDDQVWGYNTVTQRPQLFSMGTNLDIDLSTNSLKVVGLSDVALSGDYDDLLNKPTLLQGEEGPQGPQGEPGEDGVDGKSAYEVAVDEGFIGDETTWLGSLVGPQGPEGEQGESIEGPEGPEGMSAYQVAVDNGFVGTAPQWLASLVGPAGVTGATGSTGSSGSAATVAVGSVTTGAAGSNVSVTNSGTSSAATLDFTIPRGDTGATGPAGPSAYGAPSSRSLSLATAYQCTDNTKPCLMTITLQSTSGISLSGAVNNEGAITLGPTSAVASGTGTNIATYKNNLGGTLVVGLNLNSNQANSYTVAVPAGWYFAVRQTAGSGLQVVSTFEQLSGS